MLGFIFSEMALGQPENLPTHLIRVTCEISGESRSDLRYQKITRPGYRSSIKIPAFYHKELAAWEVSWRLLQVMENYCADRLATGNSFTLKASNSSLWEWLAFKKPVVARHPETGVMQRSGNFSKLDCLGAVRRHSLLDHNIWGRRLLMQETATDDSVIESALNHPGFIYLTLELKKRLESWFRLSELRQMISLYRQYVLSVGEYFGEKITVTGDNVLFYSMVLISEMLSYEEASEKSLDLLAEYYLHHPELAGQLDSEEQYYLVSLLVSWEYIKSSWRREISTPKESGCVNNCQPPP